MKRLLPLVLVASLACEAVETPVEPGMMMEVVAARDIGSEVLDDLIAYYPFDGDYDDVTGAHNADPGTTTTFGVGKFGSAAEFDGNTSSVISAPFSTDFQFQGAYAVAAWFNVTVNSTNETRKLVGVMNANEWGLVFLEHTEEVQSRYEHGPDTDAIIGHDLGPAPAPFGDWHHVVGQYNPGTGLHELYVDGFLEKTAPHPPPGITATSTLDFGGEPGFPTYVGLLDEVRIYSRALTCAEIRTLADVSVPCEDPPDPPEGCQTPAGGVTPAGPTAGLIAYYPFDCSNTDESGNGLDGQTFGGPIFAQDRLNIDDRAYQFDGADDRFSVPDDPSLDELATMSITAWINPANVSQQQNIVSKLDNTTLTSEQAFEFLLVGTELRATLYDNPSGAPGPGAALITRQAPGAVSTGWHHVAMTYDGGTTPDAMTLYVDGVEASSFGGQSPNAFVAMQDVKAELEIGARRIGSGAFALFFGGGIDEVRIYDRELDPGEIEDLFDLTPPLPNGPPEVATDTDPAIADEGQAANNAGTVSDPDDDDVTLSASIGTVINNNDGTWSWSFGTADGPAESQTVTIDADDGNGGVAQTSFTLTVNNVDPTVTGVTVPQAPVAIGDQPVSVIGTFSDPGGTADEPYSCAVDYGEAGGPGPQAGTVSGTTCTGPDQTYAEPGVYTVTVSVTDKDGGTGSLSSEMMIVIYDPSDGFVTGGGWFTSPVGAFKADELLTGKANFGFVAKYKKGATVPTGTTEFQFKTGDLNFHSASYDWLVVNQNDENAQFTGEGTINGTGVYKFSVWAGDKDPDTFRIRITEVGGGIVYDNGVDQPIDGGSIKIHSK